MTKSSKKPVEPPPEDSLKKLAEFTKRILRVPKDELKDKRGSSGPISNKSTCQET
jgi:hypothetical protein